MEYDDNLYYHPEKSGFEIVAVADAAGDWEFDVILVLRDTATGQVYAAHDSGCSCPTPFEFTSRGDLLPVASVADVMAFASRVWPEDDGYGDRDYNGSRVGLAERLALGWGS